MKTLKSRIFFGYAFVSTEPMVLVGKGMVLPLCLLTMWEVISSTDSTDKTLAPKDEH